ncbi:MAG: S-layer homology domain-containing protein [Bacillota bacterium]|nr:S-layer homology domain-containing protein [Bacillota bacterium]
MSGGNDAGGLVGNGEAMNVYCSYALGNVEVNGYANVGGLIGYNSNGRLLDNYAAGSVNGGGGASVGGLVGRCVDGSMYDNYASGNVTGGNSSYTGGLIGRDKSCTVSNNYALGNVNAGAGAHAGGFVGLCVYDPGTCGISYGYWNSSADQKINNAAVDIKKGVGEGVDDTYLTAKTSEEMKSAAFTALLNEHKSADTLKLWGNVSGINNGYPIMTLNSPAEAGTVAAVTPKTEITVSGNTVTASTSTTATVDSSGKATASVTQAQVNEIISKAVEEAAKQGNGAAVVAEIKVEVSAGAKTVETDLPKMAVDAVAKSNAEALTVSTPIASIMFGKEALDTIAGEATADVKIAASKVDPGNLDQETKQAIDDRPVFNFSVTSGDKTISQFNGNVTVSVPYTPRTGEDTSAIVIYYINAEGKAEIVSNCAYDPATGTISYTTNHFSTYAVGYNKVGFNDVSANSWYAKAVSFIAARGITTGTGNGNYSPDTKLTRGEFLVMMMRAYGIIPDKSPKDNFADAGSTYYTGYLAAAKRLGISGGVGNNMFAPERKITRQEMFTLLYNALKVIGQLPEWNSGKKLSNFSDAEQVASWAKDAMTFFVGSGTISGSGGKLSPAGTATRAEMAQIIYNLLSK